MNFKKFFEKPIFRTPPHDCSCWFLHYNHDFIHWSHFLCFILHFHLFIKDNCNYGSLFSLLLFTIIYQKIIWMLSTKYALANNLRMHFWENTDFPLQQTQHLLSAEVNFKGWKILNHKITIRKTMHNFCMTRSYNTDKFAIIKLAFILGKFCKFGAKELEFHKCMVNMCGFTDQLLHTNTYHFSWHHKT